MLATLSDEPSSVSSIHVKHFKLHITLAPADLTLSLTSLPYMDMPHPHTLKYHMHEQINTRMHIYINKNKMYKTGSSFVMRRSIYKSTVSEHSLGIYTQTVGNVFPSISKTKTQQIE